MYYQDSGVICGSSKIYRIDINIQTFLERSRSGRGKVLHPVDFACSRAFVQAGKPFAQDRSEVCKKKKFIATELRVGNDQPSNKVFPKSEFFRHVS